MAHRIAVAASGGRDSTALLHATARAARGNGIEVHALHVHHGLMPEADEWLAHLRRQCARWTRAGLPVHFHSTRLQGRPARGDSVEAWARRERYTALAAMARELHIDTVLLAHHRRDQAETVLLQALRGAGPAGLAAMPAEADRGGVRWLRPWLAQPRAAIEAYVKRHRLRFVDDTSNADPRFLRNRLRVEVWAAIEAAFPDAEATFAATARRAHEAAVCSRALAAIDAAACVDGQGGLRRANWLELIPARRANLVREWLRERLREWLREGMRDGLRENAEFVLPESLVQRLLDELPRARSGAAWPLPPGALRLHRGVLVWGSASAPGRPQPPPLTIDLSRLGMVEVPAWWGAFEVRRGTGIPAAVLTQAQLRPRAGGEQFQLAPLAAVRSLKKQFQALGIPAWQRVGPLLYAAETLLFVPGLGIDARAPVAGGSRGRTLRWQPHGSR